MVDPERIHDRLGRLDALLDRLERVHAKGESQFLGEQDTQLVAERALQLAIQVCIDVGAHLVAEGAGEPPRDYRGVFEALAARGTLEENLAARLGAAAGLRNLLVHGYAEIDPKRVWAALDSLDDLREFARAAARAAGEIN